MKYTPGPWLVDEQSEYIYVDGACDGEPDRIYVAEVYRTQDARIISAAPEMLEALKGLLTLPMKDAIVLVKAAVHKAEGNSYENR